MYKIIIIVCSVILLTTINSNSQCIQGDCKKGKGMFKFENGDIYEGEFIDSEITGKGKFVFNKGGYQEGFFYKSQLKGKGKTVHKDGSYQEGEFIDDKLEGYGTQFNIKDNSKIEGKFSKGELTDGYSKITYSNGSSYEGNLLNGNPNGYGSYIAELGDKYVGEFKMGKREGKGTQYYKNGEKHEGEWFDNEQHGKGTTFLSNNNRLVGIWKFGKFIDNNGNSDDKINFKEKIPMKKTKGVYTIPVTFNSSVTVNCIMDTGASEVLITPDVLSILIREQKVDDFDKLETKSFVDANGKIDDKARYNIREIKIGNTILKNVECALSNNLEVDLLLGQSVLTRLGKIMLDFENELFFITE